MAVSDANGRAGSEVLHEHVGPGEQFGQDLPAGRRFQVERQLLRVDRLYLDTAGHPVELAISHFLPELYSYRTNLRRSMA